MWCCKRYLWFQVAFENAHFKYSWKKEPYQCFICEKAFCNEDLLKQHNAVVHVGKKAHKCSKCDGIFGSRYYLNKHMSDVHEVKKAQRSKKKKSKKKKNHLKVSEKVKKWCTTLNIAELDLSTTKSLMNWFAIS